MEIIWVVERTNTLKAGIDTGLRDVSRITGRWRGGAKDEIDEKAAVGDATVS